jgi:hypothetical protein
MTTWLFSNFGAALKAQTAMLHMMELMHRNPTMDVDTAATLTARLMNEDFGGLHWERMGVSPKTVAAMRMLLLAPDWTGSNFLTVVRMVKPTAFGGTDAATTENKGLVRKMYAKFWAGVYLKGLTVTFALNMLMYGLSKATGEDDDDDYTDKMVRAWRQNPGRFLWLDVDVTPLYRMLGGKEKNPRYITVLGHFKDPLKWVFEPAGSIKAKGSAITRIIYEAFTGSDWKGDGFTTLSELLGVDEAGEYKSSGPGHRKGDPKGGQYKWKTTKRGVAGETIGWSTLPSYLIHEVASAMPIQVQNTLGWLNGSAAGFESLGRGLGIDIKRGSKTDFDIIADRAEAISTKVDTLRTTDRKELVEFLQEGNNRRLYALSTRVAKTNSEVKKLKAQIMALEKNEKLSPESRRRNTEALEKRIEALQSSAVSVFKKAMEG